MVRSSTRRAKGKDAYPGNNDGQDHEQGESKALRNSHVIVEVPNDKKADALKDRDSHGHDAVRPFLVHINHDVIAPRYQLDYCKAHRKD